MILSPRIAAASSDLSEGVLNGVFNRTGAVGTFGCRS